MTPVSLNDILRGRDERRRAQRELLNGYGKPLVSLTVVMPGEVKLNYTSVRAGNTAVEQVRKVFGESILFSAVNDKKPTGFEAMFVVEGDTLSVKRQTCRIEDSHPIGRLFDLDVIGLDGVPVSRRDCGLAERKCLICEETARDCVRARRHSVNEILAEIETIISDYP